MSLTLMHIEHVPTQLCVPQRTYKLLAALVRDAISGQQNPDGPVPQNRVQKNIIQNILDASCIPSFCSHQITPKTSRYTRCSTSMLPNVSINGRSRSSGQLGRWWYSISPCRNNECVRRFTVFAFNQRS